MFVIAGSFYLWQVVIASAGKKKKKHKKKEDILKGNLVPLDLQIGFYRHWVPSSN